jgi:hypothetical protein
MQDDYTPAIRVSQSDFMVFSKDKTTLKMQDFVDRMRDQLESYVQSRLSSTSEFWRDEPYDYNTVGPLKHLLLEQFKMRDQIQQLLRASRVPKTDISDVKVKVNVNSDVHVKSILHNAQDDVGAEIQAIGESLRQLVSEGNLGNHECLDKQLSAICERLNQLGAAVCQLSAGALPSVTVASAPQSPLSQRDRGCQESPVVNDTSMPQARSPAGASQFISTHRAKTNPSRPKADRTSQAGSPRGLLTPRSASSRAMESAGASGLAAAAVLSKTFWKDGEDGVGAPNLRGAAPRDKSHSPSMLAQNRRFWSEGGYCKKWGGRASCVHSNGVVSLHSQMQRGDLVIVDYAPKGRCGRGPDVAGRSDWFDSEPTLL